MVEIFNLNGGNSQLVLSPNQSLSVTQSYKFLCTFFGFSMVVAASFTYWGAWLVLPFTILDSLLLFMAFYWVRWHQRYREVLTINKRQVSLQAGIGRPSINWTANTRDFRLRIDTAKTWRRPVLYLCGGDSVMEIGQCLNTRDKKLLVDKLRTMGVRVLTAGPSVCVEF